MAVMTGLSSRVGGREILGLCSEAAEHFRAFMWNFFLH